MADEKDFGRHPDNARLKRTDGAWLHFSLALKVDEQGHVSDLHADGFELVFPEGHQPSFVRYDLNEKDHEDDKRWIRCHLHPGNDDLMIPAPVMSPEELLDVLLRRESRRTIWSASALVTTLVRRYGRPARSKRAVMPLTMSWIHSSSESLPR